MKQLVCEMCGSNDLIKDGGVFVCQSCGCKYTVEEARRMMIEGTVDVSGSTVKVDNEQKLANLRQLAQRAKEEGDSQTATKYFEQILLEDPDDWEANFYTIYYAAHDIKIAQIGAAASRVSNIVGPVLELIKKNVTDPIKQKSAYIQVTSAMLSYSTMLFNNITSNIGTTREQASANIEKWAIPTITMLVLTGDKLTEFFGDDEFALEIIERLYNTAKGYSKTSASFCTKAIQLDRTIDGRISSISDVRKKIKQKRVQEYWDAHPEEKASLEAEIASIREQIDAVEAEKNAAVSKLEEEKNAISMPQEYYSIEETVKKLSEEKNALGIFKGKEKKQLQEKIERLTAEQSAIVRKRDEAINAVTYRINAEKRVAKNKIDALRAQIDEIARKLNSCD